jgi:hypothetical protein
MLKQQQALCGLETRIGAWVAIGHILVVIHGARQTLAARAAKPKY